MEIWDTAGQERFQSISRNYYSGAIGIILVYDVTNAQSFQKCEEWLSEVMNNARSECSVCLVGNKVDLVNEKVIQSEEGSSFCKENSEFIRRSVV